MSVVNAVTVDLEDWFHVLYYETAVDRGDWDGFESRIEANTRRALGLLDRVGARATFFVLGWVAERRPELILEIARRGHEIASHSYAHRLVHTLTRAEFAEDLRRSLRVLSGITGRPLRGYRAPSFSVTDATPWVFEELAGAGLDYDSSVLPVRRRYGGKSAATRHPHRVVVPGIGSVREFPMSTVRVLGRNICFSGGGYLRLFPEWIVDAMITARNRAGEPVVVYFHPWELDPCPPRLRIGIRKRLGYGFSNEIGRSGMEGKLERILKRRQFAPMARVLDRLLPVRGVA